MASRPAQDVARRIPKRMVGRVLTGIGITRYGNVATTLIGGEELSDTEHEESEFRA